jgi:hypothetical protein
MKEETMTGFETRAEGKAPSPVRGYETTHTSLGRTSIPRIRSPNSSYFTGKSIRPGFTSMRQFCLLNIVSSFRASSSSRGAYQMPLLQTNRNAKPVSSQIPAKKRHALCLLCMWAYVFFSRYPSLQSACFITGNISSQWISMEFGICIPQK